MMTSPTKFGRWVGMTVADKTSAITALVQGGQSCGQMGKALGATRNMILSHARRYKIPLATAVPQQSVARVARAKLQVSRKQPSMRVLPPVSSETWQPHRAPVSLLDLADNACRWPVGAGEGSAQLFCGDHAGRRGYCERHAGVAKGQSVYHPCTTESRLRPSKTREP